MADSQVLSPDDQGPKGPPPPASTPQPEQPASETGRQPPRIERQAGVAAIFLAAVVWGYNYCEGYVNGKARENCSVAYPQGKVNQNKDQNSNKPNPTPKTVDQNKDSNSSRPTLEWGKSNQDPNFNDAIKARLEGQYQEIQAWSQCRANLTVFFLSQYYAAMVITAITAGISAIALIYTTKASLSRTWQTRPWIATVFVAAGATATFYGSFPSLFRQQENMTANNNAFIQSMALSNKIKTYIATRLSADSSVPATDKPVAPTKPDQFILMIDEQMKDLFNLTPSFDPSKQPQFNKLTPP